MPEFLQGSKDNTQERENLNFISKSLVCCVATFRPDLMLWTAAARTTGYMHDKSQK